MSEDPQVETIAALSDPETYGGATPVQRIDTHISSVFLVGDRVYKLKRAFVFDYLDFSDREKRREYCLAEVAINRRTAPQLYLGVAPVIRGPSGRLEIGSVGEVVPDAVDWLVVMHRFDQDSLFDRLARQGRLTPGNMADLASTIAAFHGVAAPSSGGGAAAIARVIASMEKEINRGVPDDFNSSEAADLIAAWRRDSSRLTGALDARRDEG